MRRRYWSYRLPIPITAMRSIPDDSYGAMAREGVEPCRSDHTSFAMDTRRIAAILTTLLASLGTSAQPVEPRTVSPRGPLLPAEQSVVRLFENAAPSVAYITTERLEATS